MNGAEVVVMPRWDLFVLGGFFVVALFALLLQKEKLLVALMGLYVSLAVTQAWGDKIAAFFMGQNFIGSFWIKANLNPFWVKLIFFFLILFLFIYRSDLVVSVKNEPQSSFLLSSLYSLAFAVLLVSSILKLLPDPLANSIILQSKFASFLYIHYNWWVILPLILVIVGGYWSAKSKE
ncbi:hypothetical protein J7L13_03445 [bacterium]|nr:hypothetical protein [bacterium]